MRRVTVTSSALVAVLLMLASACSGTEPVTVLPAPAPLALPAPGAVATPTAVAANAETASSGTGEAEESPGDEVLGITKESADISGGSDKAEPVRPRATTCTYLGVDNFGDMQIELQLTGDLDVQSDVAVLYTVWGGPRDVLAEATQVIQDLAPGEIVRMQTDTLIDGPADDAQVTCTATDAASTDTADTPGPFRATQLDTCFFIELDFAADAQLGMTVINPLDTTSALSVDYALRTPDGVRFNDGVAYFDAIAPGQSAVVGVDTFDRLPPWVDESMISCEVLAITGN